MQFTTLNILLGLNALLLFAVLCIPLAYLKRDQLIYLVIPLNVVADMLIVFTGDDAILHSGLARIPLLALFIALSVPKIELDRVTTIILIFLGYLAILVLFSTNITRSVTTYVKIVLSLLMIPIGYYSITSLKQFKKLYLSLLIAVGIGILNYLFIQIFELGDQLYGDEAIFLTGNSLYITYIIVYALILAPLAYRLFPVQTTQIGMSVLYGLGVVTIFVTLRRGSILAIVLGYGVFLLFGNWRLRTQMVILATIGIIFMLFIPPFSNSSFATLFEERILVFVAADFEGQTVMGRLNETRTVFYEFTHRSFKHTLIGTDLFNSVEESALFVNGRGRNLHIDFNNLLFGSGIVGLVLYFSIYATIAFTFFEAQNLLPFNTLSKTFTVTFWAFLVCSFALSLSSQIYVVTPFSCFCLFVGAMLRVGVDSAEIPTLPQNHTVHLETPQYLT